MKPIEETVSMLLAGSQEPESLIRGRFSTPGGAAVPVIGKLVGISEGGVPQVDFPGNPAKDPIPARAVVALGDAEVGRLAVLIFERGEISKPVIAGLLQPSRTSGGHHGVDHELGPRVVQVEADGEKVVLTARKEIVLRCGKASITLTSAGKILIRGDYVLTQSSGVNRIRGGSVQIN